MLDATDQLFVDHELGRTIWQMGGHEQPLTTMILRIGPTRITKDKNQPIDRNQITRENKQRNCGLYCQPIHVLFLVDPLVAILSHMSP